MSEPTDKTLQQHFYSQFQASRTDLAARLEASKHNTTTHNSWQELASDITKLGKSLADATSFLSSYDQRQFQAQISSLEQGLEEVRSASVPKTKFAFKRKTDNPRPSAATSFPAPSSHIANELREGEAVSGMSTFHKISSHSNCRLSLRSILTLGPGSSSFDLTISDLDRCIVDLSNVAEIVPHRQQLCLTALHARNLRETVLILPSVKGSVLLHRLRRCTVIVASHQFRMHHSTNVRVYLAAMSNPIIENCTAIAFAEYPPFVALVHPSVNEGLPLNGKHTDVQDFSHIRPSPSPNWFLSPSRGENWDDLLTSDDPSPQGLDSILAAHLPDMMSTFGLESPYSVFPLRPYCTKLEDLDPCCQA